MKKESKTLYLTDLDGTLLNNKKEVTQTTADLLNSLIDSGRLLFSVATARSPASVAGVLSGLHLNLPVILMNGVLIYDIKAGRCISAEILSKDMVGYVLSVLRTHGKTPFLYTMEQHEISVYFESLDNGAEVQFYTERAGLQYKRFVQVEHLSQGFGAPAVNLFMIDTYELLAPAYEQLKREDKVSASFYRDNYSDGWVLEIYNRSASKEAGAGRVKDFCGADAVVAFGDNHNDMGLIRSADRGYAVANAVKELKKAAHGVIGENEEDGVARWIAAELSAK